METTVNISGGTTGGESITDGTCGTSIGITSGYTYIPNDSDCPYCGKCRHCGRGGFQFVPVPYYPYYPSYPIITWGTSGSNVGTWSAGSINQSSF